MPIVSAVFTVLIFMIPFTGIPGVTGILSTMIHGIIHPGILLHGLMPGTGDGVQAGTTDLIVPGDGVTDIHITATIAHIIMVGGIPTTDMVVDTTTDITTDITVAGGMPTPTITVMAKEGLPEQMFTGEKVAEG